MIKSFDSKYQPKVQKTVSGTWFELQVMLQLRHKIDFVPRRRRIGGEDRKFTSEYEKEVRRLQPGETLR